MPLAPQCSGNDEAAGFRGLEQAENARIGTAAHGYPDHYPDHDPFIFIGCAELGAAWAGEERVGADG